METLVEGAPTGAMIWHGIFKVPTPACTCWKCAIPHYWPNTVEAATVLCAPSVAALLVAASIQPPPWSTWLQ